MKNLTIKKFKNAEEGEFTYGLYDGEEEICSCICESDAEAHKILAVNNTYELDTKYGRGNWIVLSQEVEK